MATKKKRVRKAKVRKLKLKPAGKLQERLGQQFRAVRRAHKVFLRPLSSALGRSINTVRWHEAGVRMLRADDLVRAAEIIGCDVSLLTEIHADEKHTRRSTDRAGAAAVAHA